MSATFERVLAECKEAAAQMSDASLNASMGDVLSALNEPTCISIADMNAANESVLKVIDAYCGMTLPRKLLTDLRNGEVCLTLQSGGTESLLRSMPEGVQVTEPGQVFAGQSGTEAAELVYTHTTTLCTDHFMLCSALSKTDTWKKLLNHIDVICLHVNATVAMTYSEKALIGMLSTRFTERPAAIWLDNLEKLNSDEDREAVLSGVQAALKRANVQASILCTADEAVQWLRESREQPDLKQRKERSILRNLMQDMQERIDALLLEADTSSQDYEAAIRQINSQRNRLEAAGQVAATATLGNAFDQLKYDVHDGMRDYNEQMVTQIVNKIKTATSDELERMDTLIPAYQTRAWELYQTRLADALNARYDAIFQSIMQCMEEDAGELYKQLDADTLALLSKTMGLHEIYMARGVPAGGDLNSIEKLKRETRNMMLLSIPAVLVSIPLGLATLVGTKLLGNLGMHMAEEEYRKQLLSSVGNSANVYLRQILDHVDVKFDEAKQASAENIRKAYAQLVDLLIGNIRKQEEEHEQLRKQAALYTDIRSTKIPEWLSLLANA